MSETQFAPPKSVVPFLVADKFSNFIVGPVGSTKTTASIMKIAREAARIAPCKDGVRRSRCAVVRNTNEMLRDTTIPDFEKWLGAGGQLQITNKKFMLRFGLDDDTQVECEVLFRGLDDANDVRRLLSLQLTFGFMDEFREIHPDVYNALTGRIGRYPDKSMNGVGCCDDKGKAIHKIWGSTNPPDSDTFWEELLTNPPDNMSVTFQPSGMAPEADWVDYLPDGYYENLCKGKTEDWIDVYVHGKFGRSLSGQPVFRCFNPDTHVAKDAVNVLQQPVLIGVDAGLNPSATLGQITYDGRLVIHDSITGNEGGMGALRFCREKLKPLLANKYKGLQVAVIIDPAAFQRAQTDERSVADIFKAEGFTVKPAKTNSISARLAACESYMTRTVGDKPALLVAKEASLLIQSLRGKYRYKINTKGERDDKPEKSHPWSDICFISGTPILTPSGYVPIDSLRLGDAVCVNDGIDFVTAIGSSEAHRLVRVELSDGTALTCTPNHPFILANTCILPADELKSGYELASVKDGKWESGQWRTLRSGQLVVRVQAAVLRLKLLLGAWLKARVNTVVKIATESVVGRQQESSTTGYGLLGQGKTITTGTSGLIKALSLCIDVCGSTTTAQFQKDTTYTISTVTHPTTNLVTLNVCKEKITAENTCYGVLKTEPSMLQRLWQKLGKPQKSGIAHLKEDSGTANTQKESPLTVERVVKLDVGGTVHNLTTERTHVYYAKNALVHNCDSFQYLCLHADNGGIFGSVGQSKAREVVKAEFRWT